MTVGRKSFVLGPGDSVRFDLRLLYSAAATADGDVRLIWVGTSGPI
ncbi:cupin domain-containing protein [Gluconacetobacter sacchari]|uniref:Cupin domain-containing protein n=1 Tax=Gluconacetobacter sacchari TaxID=92759 RepID=A0A7W4NJE4_9PROT|nr:cupin domain-containing protein [Gluconacetobacter sacchari]